jgi:hypothetical protein
LAAVVLQTQVEQILHCLVQTLRLLLQLVAGVAHLILLLKLVGLVAVVLVRTRAVHKVLLREQRIKGLAVAMATVSRQLSTAVAGVEQPKRETRILLVLVATVLLRP